MPVDLAIHIADAGTLSRRAPAFEVPNVALEVVVPRVVYDPSEPGALATVALLTPRSAREVRYSLPKDIDPGGGLWRTCPTTGLELRVETANGAWFKKSSGMMAVLGPEQLGVDATPEALQQVAWWVLFDATAAGEGVIKDLFDIAVRLEITGLGGAASIALASRLAERWRIGQGLVAAARSGNCWLNPRALRWLAKDLAAARSVGARDFEIEVEMNGEAQIVYQAWFPHLASRQRALDVCDVTMAAWFLQGAFHGTDHVPAGPDGDMLGLLSAIGYSTAADDSSFQRIETWSKLWSVDDGEALAGHPDWGGVPPSTLRTTFESLTGLTIEQWYGAALAIMHWIWTDSTSPGMAPGGDLGGFVEASPMAPLAQAIVAQHLTINVHDLGDDVAGRAPGGYTRLGSSAQSEQSVLLQRPIVHFRDGSRLLSSPSAFVRAAIHLPRRILVESGVHGTNQDVGSPLGYMFEAFGTRLLRDGLTRCQVLDGEAIDAVAELGTARGDVVVADTNAIVSLEFGMQPINAGTVSGDPMAADEMLDRYAKKMRQATGTPGAGSDLFSIIPLSGRATIGHFVVVDEPMTFTALHCVRVREKHPDLPELFVVGIDDLARLVNAAKKGISFPAALVAWQRGGSRLPFAHRLLTIDRVVSVDGPAIGGEGHRLLRSFLEPT